MSEKNITTRLWTWIANNKRRIEWYQGDVNKEVARLHALFGDPEKDSRALVAAIRSEVPERVREIEKKMQEIKRLSDINDNLLYVIEEAGETTPEEQPGQ